MNYPTAAWLRRLRRSVAEDIRSLHGRTWSVVGAGCLSIAFQVHNFSSLPQLQMAAFTCVLIFMTFQGSKYLVRSVVSLALALLLIALVLSAFYGFSVVYRNVPSGDVYRMEMLVGAAALIGFVVGNSSGARISLDTSLGIAGLILGIVGLVSITQSVAAPYLVTFHVLDQVTDTPGVPHSQVTAVYKDPAGSDHVATSTDGTLKIESQYPFTNSQVTLYVYSAANPAFYYTDSFDPAPVGIFDARIAWQAFTNLASFGTSRDSAPEISRSLPRLPAAVKIP